jgi:hypothetical protein
LRARLILGRFITGSDRALEGYDGQMGRRTRDSGLMTRQMGLVFCGRPAAISMKVVSSMGRPAAKASTPTKTELSTSVSGIKTGNMGKALST